MIGIKLPVGGMCVMMLKEYTLHTCNHLGKRQGRWETVVY